MMHSVLTTICFLTLLSESRERATESYAESLDEFTIDGHQFEGNDSTTVITSKSQDVQVNRSLHSRMKSLDQIFPSSTTPQPTAFDYWWFFTTSKRPFISYRDYPGKPGVATWKEISPAGAKETRKDRKMDDPTAAGVSSRAESLSGMSAILGLVCLFATKDFFGRLAFEGTRGSAPEDDLR